MSHLCLDSPSVNRLLRRKLVQIVYEFKLVKRRNEHFNSQMLRRLVPLKERRRERC